MHDEKRWRLLIYDIRDVERYRASVKLIKGAADRVQYSVFRGHLDDRQLAELRARLARSLDPADDLLVVTLCPGCAEHVITSKAAEAWGEAPPRFSIVRSTRQKTNEESLP